MDKKAILKILLDNNASLVILQSSTQLLTQLSSVRMNGDSEPSIGIFPWFDNPDIMRSSGFLFLLNRIVVVEDSKNASFILILQIISNWHKFEWIPSFFLQIAIEILKKQLFRMQL